MGYEDFNDLTRRTRFVKILRDKAFNFARNPKNDGYQRGLALMVSTFFDKKHSGGGIKKENISNLELVEELYKLLENQIYGNLYSPFTGNIWGAEIADMQLISKFRNGFCFLLCVTDIFSKYAWVVPLKDKKCITITNAFQKILDESNRKLNKMWVDKGSKFYNRSMK